MNYRSAWPSSTSRIPEHTLTASRLGLQSAGSGSDTRDAHRGQLLDPILGPFGKINGGDVVVGKLRR